MPIPSSVSAIYSTDIVSTLDIDKPERLSTLIRIHGRQGVEVYDLYRALGWAKPTAQETYRSDSDDWIIETFHSRNNQAAGAAGAAVNVTLAAVDLDASNRFYPRVKETVRFSNGVTGWISAISTAVPAQPVLTIVPQLSTDAIPALTAGEEITISAGAQGEGASMTVGAFTKTNAYTNQLQLIPEYFSVTGMEMTNQKWITEFEGDNGQKLFYIIGSDQTEDRLKIKASNALLFEKRSDNLPVDPQSLSANFAVPTTTEGLIPYTEANGIDIPYVPPFLSVNVFDTAARRLNREGVSSTDILWLCGFDFLQNVDNVLVDYNKDTAVNFTNESRMKDMYFKGNGDLMTAIGFSCLKKSGFYNYFVNIPSFSHPKIGGATGYTDSSRAIGIPMGNVKVKDGITSPIGFRYKALGNHNRTFQMWKQGAAGENPATFIGQDDLMSLSYRMNIGAHHLKGNQFVNIHAA